MKALDFNDNWRYGGKVVTLPHDAMLCGGRDKNAASGSAGAFFKGGVFEYEKMFDAPEDWRSMTVLLNFGGVYRRPKVYVNGEFAGGCAYGYSEFTLDVSAILKYGAYNTVKVVADCSEQPDSRWYSGGGIYRPVSLILGGKEHIEHNGVRITTVSADPAVIRVETKHTGGDVAVEILDGGKVAAKGTGDSTAIEIPNAKLWSDDAPNLYQCRVTLSKSGGVIDETTETFGIRKIEWSNKGLFINGKETLLRGGCIHCDNGILGAAAFKEAEHRRVRKLKEAGFNALRISHNPASRAMLDACDKYGLYVIDETWDMWYTHKKKFDYAADFDANYMFDIKSLVEKDINHPSVIMYGIGNEISEPATTKGVELTKELVRVFHSLDNSRPVTAGINLMILAMSAKGKGIYDEGGAGADKSKSGAKAEDKQPPKMNSTMFNMMTQVMGPILMSAGNSKKADAVTTPCLDALDIAGYNYASGRYPKEGTAHPNRVVVGSETFPSSIAKNWEMVKKYPYLIGDFMWTAWDYLGECGVGTWSYTADGKGFNKPYPWLLADVGAMDILGDPNGELFAARAVWGLDDKPAICVQPVNHANDKVYKAVWRGTNAIPSWSWKGCDGSKAVAEVYSAAHTVELLINGKSAGKKPVKKCKAAFNVKYAPGKVEAVSFDERGRETGRSALQSAKGALAVSVAPEVKTIRVGEVAYIEVSVTGANGVVESNADVNFTADVQNGDLLAFGSANPRTEESYQSGSFTTYYGKAQAVVRGIKAGVMRVSVRGGSLSAYAEIKVEGGGDNG